MNQTFVRFFLQRAVINNSIAGGREEKEKEKEKNYCNDRKISNAPILDSPVILIAVVDNKSMAVSGLIV